jgi:hypothetical protein
MEISLIDRVVNALREHKLKSGNKSAFVFTNEKGLPLNGLFSQQIAETLNQQRITPLKGKRWTRTALNEVLKNKYYS